MVYIAPKTHEANYSFKLSRTLIGREQLDISSELGPNLCGIFQHSYWARDSPGKWNARRK